MHPQLNHEIYLIKEHLGLFKAANNYDIYDPRSAEIVMHCREPNLGPLTRLLRFSDYKRMTPFEIIVTDTTGAQVLRIERGVSIFLSKVKVYDENDRFIGGFKQKLFSIGGAFRVLDHQDQELCALQGKWSGWNYSFRNAETEYAKVSKKWSGLGRELFTCADNYVLEIHSNVPPRAPLRIMIMAAVLCIDMVLKE